MTACQQDISRRLFPCLQVVIALIFVAAMAAPVVAAGKLPVAPDDERWLQRRQEVEKVIITGADKISPGEIIRRMEMRKNSGWAKFGLRKSRRILRGAWDRDRQAILTFYQAHGFLNAAVTISLTKDEKTERAIVTVEVVEGPRTVWGTVEIVDTTTGIAYRTKRWLRQIKRGKPANPRLLHQVVAECKTTYADFGHPYAQFNAGWNVDSTRWDTANVTITVDAGARTYFGDVKIEGNTYTKTRIVRRELDFKPGDLYSRKKIIESQNNIYRTGLFTYTRLRAAADSVDGAPVAQGNPNFTVKVVERKPSYVGFATGAGQDKQQDLTWDYSLEWGTRNWFGTGRKWALTAKSEFIVVTDWRVLYHRFEASYTEPWVFGLRLPTTIQLAYEPGVRSAVQPYRIEKIEGELNFSRRFDVDKQVWLSFVYENVNIFGIDKPIEEILAEEGITIRRKLVFAIEKDSRPNIFIPTSGSHTRLDAEYAGGFLGGDIDFYKLVGSWSRYQMMAASVFATQLKFGWVKSHSGGPPVPTSDRFYLGGANSIRGYSENGVGPMTDGTPEGGGVIAVGNIELRTPVIWKLWFTVFGDAGNNWSNYHDMAIDDILVSLGLGVQFISPVGPLRLDYGRRVRHHNHPASDRVHLAILFAF